jgi:hypothetical protein
LLEEENSDSDENKRRSRIKSGDDEGEAFRNTIPALWYLRCAKDTQSSGLRRPLGQDDEVKRK